jgi:HSP20 family protein
MKLTRSQRRELGQWSPFDQLTRLRDEINRIFEPSDWRMSSLSDGWSPALDMFEDKDSVTVKTELPGLKKEDIDVSIEGDTLCICGERKHEEEHGKGENYQSERYFGRFYRNVTLPYAVDASKVNASYRDGVLTVTLPKSEEAKRKQIAVQVK